MLVVITRCCFRQIYWVSKKKTFKYDTDPNSSWADAALNPSFKQESSLKKIYDEIDVATTPYCPDGEKGGDPN